MDQDLAADLILPWAVLAIPGYISIHWMLKGQWGLVNNVIWSL